MVVLNPNNWHWVDRNTLPWTKKYIEDEFNGWEVETEDYLFRVVSVGMISGDSSVSQRKGKVICYFDLNLDFRVSVHGKNEKEGDELCQGTITIPEFIHDESEFEMNYSGFGNQESVLRVGFAPQLRSELLKYQARLIEEHSESVQHAA